MRVALLGTGIMGTGMAHAMLRAGHRVTAWNRNRERAAPLRDAGATVATDIGDAVSQADVMITMVADADAVHSIATQAIPSLPAEAVWLQTSTVGPESATDLAKMAGDAGVRFVDAPVLGTKAPAEQGTLSSLVSGPAELIDVVRPVLDALSSRVTVVGTDPGLASALKLACNSWLAMLTVGTAQAIALTQMAGLDPRLFLSAIKDFAVDSGYAQLKGPLMIDADYDDTAFPVSGVVKDLGLIDDMASSSGTSTTLIDALRDIFGRAAAAGHGQQDMAAVRTQF
jgi:3-hydroxyisobutyrate dehydrogenase